MFDKTTGEANVKTAVLVDGGFFHKRYRFIEPKSKKETPLDTAKYLQTMVHKHVENQYLYRVFYYDCLPYDKKLHNPITNEVINFSESASAKFAYQFIEHLKKFRKFALRLGYLKDNYRYPWKLNDSKLKDLLDFQQNIEKTIPKEKMSVAQLQKGKIEKSDIYPDLRQKGVDIRIGVDITSLAYKKLVDRIILISGDSDFVPAAKIARREGIDFILDPMWNHVSPDLFEHIDGMRSVIAKPKHHKKV